MNYDTAVWLAALVRLTVAGAIIYVGWGPLDTSLPVIGLGVVVALLPFLIAAANAVEPGIHGG